MPVFGGEKKHRKSNEFNTSLKNNNVSFHFYLNRLVELSVSMFDWQNLPETCDARYIETRLFYNGAVVFFEDKELGGMLSLDCIPQGNFDVYGYPIRRRAYSYYNHYQRELDNKNSVICFNNYLRLNSVIGATYYAQRLWDLDRIIDINAAAQKTPILIQGDEKERLSLKNLYKEYDGMAPVIYGTKGLNPDALKVLKTDAPYVADKLSQLRNEIWGEALTYLGISNIGYEKAERMNVNEITKQMGGTIASRYSRLESRKEAVDKINTMFGTNIKVEYREDEMAEGIESKAEKEEEGEENNE